MVCFLESLNFQFYLINKDFETVPCMYPGSSEKEKQVSSAGMFHNWFKNAEKVKEVTSYSWYSLY